MSNLKALPTKGEANEVQERLQEALAREYDEVFIIGVKNGLLCTTFSGYKNIEQKLGAIELLKHNMIQGAS